MSTAKSQQKQGIKRGCWLTAMLILILAGNALVALIYLIPAFSYNQWPLPLDAPSWAAPILAILSIGNCAFAVLLWKWKTWALYGLTISALMSYSINGYIFGDWFAPLRTLTLNLLGIVILVLLTYKALSYDLERFKVIYHQGDTIDIKTKADTGFASMTDDALTIQGKSSMSIALSDIKNAELLRLFHGAGRIIKVTHLSGILFITAVHFSLFGYFADVYSLKTDELFKRLNQSGKKNSPKTSCT